AAGGRAAAERAARHARGGDQLRGLGGGARPPLGADGAGQAGAAAHQPAERAAMSEDRFLPRPTRLPLLGSRVTALDARGRYLCPGTVALYRAAADGHDFWNRNDAGELARVPERSLSLH